MIFGLAAAFGWGLDLWAGMAGRRIGSGRTLVVADLRRDRGDPARDHGSAGSVRPPRAQPGSSRLRSVGAGAFATLYRGLELGPIAVVSPVLATYAVVPVFLGGPARRVARSGVGGSGDHDRGSSPDIDRPSRLRGGSFTRFAGLPWAIASTPLFRSRPTCWGGRPRRPGSSLRCGSRGDVVDRRPRRCASSGCGRTGAGGPRPALPSALRPPRSEAWSSCWERWSTREAPRSAWSRS